MENPWNSVGLGGLGVSIEQPAEEDPWEGGGGSGMHRKRGRYPPVCHSVGLLFLYGALDTHPFSPSHVASGRCVLSAAAAGAPAGVVSAFVEPSAWCVGAVLVAAGCAVCASAAPNKWRIEGVLVVAGLPPPLPLQGTQPTPSHCFPDAKCQLQRHW